MVPLFYRLSCLVCSAWLAKVSKLWHFYHAVDAKQYLLREDMRQKYRDVVPTGELKSLIP